MLRPKGKKTNIARACDYFNNINSGKSCNEQGCVIDVKKKD